MRNSPRWRFAISLDFCRFIVPVAAFCWLTGCNRESATTAEAVDGPKPDTVIKAEPEAPKPAFTLAEAQSDGAALPPAMAVRSKKDPTRQMTADPVQLSRDQLGVAQVLQASPVRAGSSVESPASSNPPVVTTPASGLEGTVVPAAPAN